MSDGLAAPAGHLEIYATIAPTTATLGDQQAQVTYCGLWPGGVGIAQVNITIPNIPPGDYQLTIAVGGVISNAGKISVQ